MHWFRPFDIAVCSDKLKVGCSEIHIISLNILQIIKPETIGIHHLKVKGAYSGTLENNR